jgi:hypothetical protein
VSETVDWVNENIIHFSTIYGCKKGFYIPPPPSRAKRANVEGTQLHGGLILGCEEDGIYISRGALAGGMFVTGGIDNGLEAREYVNNVRYPTDDSLGNLLALKFMFDGPAKEGNGDPVYQAHPHDILLNPHLGEIKIGNNEIHDGTQPPINLSYEEGNFGGDFEEFAPDQADATAPAYVATDRDGAEPTHRLFVESPDGWVSFAPEGTRRT